MAGVFFFIMFADIGSHAIADPGNGSSARAWTWCEIMHHQSPSADCPHKKHPFGPQNVSSGEVTHQWILIDDLTIPVRGVAYSTEPIWLREPDPVTRTLEPPFHPPQQA